MKNRMHLICALACLVPAACATPGGGRMGIVLFDPNQHVSGANPLVGPYENQCFHYPTYGLSFTTPDINLDGFGPVCKSIAGNVRAALGMKSGQTGTITYTKERRNEVVDSFLASSNSICSDHIKFLQQWDGNINSTLGISSQASAGLAAIVNGGLAQAMAALSALLGGARGTMQNAYFNNKTVAVLVSAFLQERNKIRGEIATGENAAIAKYTISRGVEDALRYHSSCSIAVGQDAAQRAVDQAGNPSLDTLKEFFQKVEEVRAEAAKFVKSKDNATDTTSNTAATDNTVSNSDEE
jgi:hypothetical protein